MATPQSTPEQSAAEYPLIKFEGCDVYVISPEELAKLIAKADECEDLQKQLAIATVKNRTSLANNLCPDPRDKQFGKPCLACTIEQIQYSNANLVLQLQSATGILFKNGFVNAAADIIEHVPAVSAKLKAIEDSNAKLREVVKNLIKPIPPVRVGCECFECKARAAAEVVLKEGV